MKKRGLFRVSTGLVFVSCCLFQVSANAAVDVVGEPVEEIEVTGQASSIRLRMEIKRLEAKVFDLFNEFNSTDDFDVACHNVIRLYTGSRIPIWRCEPAYLAKANAENTYFWLTGGQELKTESEVMFENRVQTERLNAEIRKLALEHPELGKAMLELNAKQQSLVEREKRIREERGLFGIPRKKVNDK